MNILSLFDGISGAKLALDNLGIECNYYASEIDPYSESVSLYHYPDIIRLGDITKIKAKDLPEIDLIIGGSPCQGFSVSGHRKGFKDPRSKLFFEFVRLVEECNPKYFILENVRMKKAWLNIISQNLNVSYVLINSALVTAQNRMRAYWANFPITQPKDRGIYLKDIIEEGITDRDKSYCIDANYFKGGNLSLYFNKKKRQLVFGEWDTEKDKNYCVTATYGNAGNLNDYFKKNKKQLLSKPVRIGEIGEGGQGQRIYSPEGKSVAINALGGGWGAKTGLYAIAQRGRYNEGKVKQRYEIGSGDKSNAITCVQKDSMIAEEDGELLLVRKLTPIECERLQGIEDNWTKYGIRNGKKVKISDTQRYKALGNGFTIPVIEHILKEVLI